MGHSYLEFAIIDPEVDLRFFALSPYNIDHDFSSDQHKHMLKRSMIHAGPQKFCTSCDSCWFTQKSHAHASSRNLQSLYVVS